MSRVRQIQKSREKRKEGNLEWEVTTVYTGLIRAEMYSFFKMRPNKMKGNKSGDWCPHVRHIIDL